MYIRAMLDGPTGPNWRNALKDHIRELYNSISMVNSGSAEWYKYRAHLNLARELLEDMDRLWTG